MKNIAYEFLSVFVLCIAAFAGVDQNPISTGSTQVRNAVGNCYEAAYSNPAILGVDHVPRGGVTLPLLNFGVGVWSDKLALTPGTLFWNDNLDKEQSDIVNKVLRRSFDLEGLNEDEVSDKLTKEFKGGVTMYTGARTSLLNGAWKRLSFDVTTHFDEELHIPEGPLYMIFSSDKGLREGNTLKFDDFRQEGIWATDFTVHLGLPVTIPALHKLFGLKYGAGGLGIKYVMGHSILKATTEEGTIQYNNNNELNVNGKVHVQTAGFGFHGPWKSDKMFGDGLPVSGLGFGVDLGGILYDERGSLVVNVQNLGVLFWMNNVRDVTYQINKNDLNAYDITKGIDEAHGDWNKASLKIFNRNEGEYLSTNDSLKESNSFVTMLPTTLNIGYSYKWDFSKNPNQQMRFLSEYTTAGADYEQNLSRGPGRSFIPRLAVGGETGTMKGIVPVRIGFVFGGPEILASAVGIGANFKYFSINASYKAIGHLLFFPSRGMELAGAINLSWGTSIDSDKDGIDDKLDKCQFIPEDFDGFEDTDGCPDYDNDKDDISDTIDKCIDIPEDKDGFEDIDGCPDFDNDKDAITDSLDKCPDQPEDKDNFKDEDGCPDSDNDGDGVTDAVDKCPNLPEDIDLFDDNDGCPDFDNDRDGLPDSTDACMNEPEAFNGYKDTDGCPDTLVRPTVKETKILNTKLRAINFKTGNAELIVESYSALDFIANFLKQYPNLRYEIQGHTDNLGSDDYNLLLSAARAGTVRTYLLSKGIPEANVIAIGYGETVPIADNNAVSGRALNRRVDFRIVETTGEYAVLKAKENLFRAQVKAAKIKGAK